MNKYLALLSRDWVSRLPPAAQPYARLMRLDKPIGTWLLLLPCWWSVALAADRWPDFGLMLLFAVGAVVMRGAGCVVNDITDRKLDPLVARTAVRPLANGEIQLWQAIVFLGALLAAGLGILSLLNRFTIWLGAASLILVFIYPFMKRVTWWPQLVLGFTFNWGAFMGWSAVKGFIGLPTLPLYIAGVFWTLAYDTIYAHQDIQDDARVGIKSTARLFGEASVPWVGLFYALSIVFLMLAGISAGLGKSAYILLLAAGLLAAGEMLMWRPSNPDNCLLRFRANREFGLLVLAAFVIGKFL